MQINNIDLNLLIAFDAFMTARNVTRAGRRLGLSQSAASGALSRLRVLFDDQLFVRGRGGIVPTPKAEQLIGPIRDGLARLQNALDTDTAFLPLIATRSFRVAMSDAASLVVLPRLLEHLRSHAPGCALHVARMDTHDVGPVLDSQADLAVGVVRKPPAGIHRMAVLQEEMVCMVRQRHPLAKSRLTPKRFAKAQHVLVSARGKRRGSMDGTLESLGMSRNVQLVVPDWTIAALVLAETDYLLTGPASIAATLARAHDLVLLRLPASLRRTASIACAWNVRMQDDSAHQWLREAVAQVAKNLASSAVRTAERGVAVAISTSALQNPSR